MTTSAPERYGDAVSAPRYDLVTVGGGLGGAALAGAMAARGAKVLVLERERRFADRVRGEVLLSWGVAELRDLGLYDNILRGGGHPLPWVELYFLGAQVQRRDLVQTTAQNLPWLAYYHPTMQEIVLAAAAAAGAEVRRGARVRGVRTGSAPAVSYEDDSGNAEVSARLVVGADGRGSTVRRWAGFETTREEARHVFTGLLLDGHGAPDDTSASTSTRRMGACRCSSLRVTGACGPTSDTIARAIRHRRKHTTSSVSSPNRPPPACRASGMRGRRRRDRWRASTRPTTRWNIRTEMAWR